MKNQILIAASLFSLMLAALFAAEPVVNPNLRAVSYKDSAAAGKLIDSRNSVVQKMHEERVAVIQSDKKARQLQKQIMELSRELSALIDSKKSMRELNKELETIDSELAKLPKK